MATPAEKGFVSIPVDAPGKKIGQLVVIELLYKTRTLVFEEGQIITFSGSVLTGVLIAHETITGTTGSITLRVSEPVPSSVTVATNAVINIAGSSAALVSDTSDGVYYYPQTQMIGSNPQNVLNIDNLGNGFVTFAGGSPNFDAYGKQQVSETTVLAEYNNKYKLDDKLWYIEQVGGGTVTHLPASSSILLSNGTASADEAAITSHLYHSFEDGQSQIIVMHTVLGDTGKTNLDRHWGYGNETDGLFFQQTDTNGIAILQLSSLVANQIHLQADWNLDTLDGSDTDFNPSGITLDVTKSNAYWIDLQGFDAGRVRFGLILNGLKIACHEIQNANIHVGPFLATGSLPVHYKQENTGVVVSTSEMRVSSTVVSTEGEFTPAVSTHYRHTRGADNQDGAGYKRAITNWHPGRLIFALRPALLKDGVTNRTVGIPTALNVANEGNYSLWIQARRKCLLNNANWIAYHGESGMDYADTGDIDLSDFGVQTGMWTVPPNSTANIDISGVFDYRKEKVFLGADGIDQITHSYAFTAWNMSVVYGGSYTVTVDVGTNTITKTTGTSFITSGLAVGQMMFLHLSAGGDDNYYVITNVTATVLTVEDVDGGAVTFAGSIADVVTIQAGEKSLYFGTLIAEEIES